MSEEGGRPDVVVVGDVMLDVAVATGALARGGDVHGDVRVRPGGSAANAAAWAAAAGASVRLYGCVGPDVAGRVLAEALHERGVDARLAVHPDAPTGAMLVVHEAGERSMVASRGANVGLRPEHLPARLAANAVLVSGYLLFHPESAPAGLQALRRAAAPVVAVEAASWPLLRAFGPDRFVSDTAGVATLLLANEREAEALTGLTGEEAAVALRARYGAACVKRGARGAVLASRDGVAAASAPPVREADPTGAGDAFDGTLLAAMARGDPAPAALAEACAAGARAAASPESWPAP